MRLSLKNVTVSEVWFNRLVIGVMTLGFLALLAAGLAAFQSIRQNQYYVGWVRHTYDVQGALADFGNTAERAEAGRRGYLLAKADTALQTYGDASRALLPQLGHIRWLTRDNPRQQANSVLLRRVVQQDQAMMERSVQLMRAGQTEAARAQFRDTRRLRIMRDLRNLVREMREEEARLLILRDRAQEDSAQFFYVTLAVAGALVLLLGSAAIWLISRYTRDLTVSRDELRLLNSDLEGAVRTRTVDLQRANDEIQRFAYIVSHDLRSPLVNVMGFTAELEAATKRLQAMIDKADAEAPDTIGDDAKLAAREDLPEAIGFIRTSTEKMDRLINAILRLSREGRRPITPEKLDMDALMRDVAATLRHRIDELGIELLIAPGLPNIVSDRLAVEQIVGNIVENATKYMQPGRPGRIEIDGRAEGKRAIFTVADNGRGIDPRDHDRIFDLFRRSGVQDRPGEGIGLAHTRALAYRLGGTISVQSELGKGATFRLSLPVTFAGEQGSQS